MPFLREFTRKAAHVRNYPVVIGQKLIQNCDLAFLHREIAELYPGDYLPTGSCLFLTITLSPIRLKLLANNGFMRR